MCWVGGWGWGWRGGRLSIGWSAGGGLKVECAIGCVLWKHASGPVRGPSSPMLYPKHHSLLQPRNPKHKWHNKAQMPVKQKSGCCGGGGPGCARYFCCCWSWCKSCCCRCCTWGPYGFCISTGMAYPSGPSGRRAFRTCTSWSWRAPGYSAASGSVPVRPPDSCPL